MSTYYNYEFVTPDSIFAEVKEELSSYFTSGVIDDVMFTKWTDDCLKRFRKSAFKIEELILHVKDYKACLPDGFEGVREAWACTTSYSHLYQSATSQYYQQDCRIDPMTTSEDKCNDCFTGANSCTTDFNVVHKITGTYYFSFRRTFLLTPGNLTTRDKYCKIGYCANVGASTPYSFDVQAGNLLTNFCDGTVHLIYYSDPSIEGDQMVPDNWWAKDFIRKYIIYKCFCKISNIVTDETFNQILQKKQEANQDQAVAFIIAETELKKQTTFQKLDAIRKSYQSFDKYNLPGDMSYRNNNRY